MGKIVIVKWRLKESEVARVLELLPELAERTRQESGNVSYTIFRSESEPCEFILHEHYVDAAAFEAHRQSEHFQRIVADKILPHLEVREVVSVTRVA